MKLGTISGMLHDRNQHLQGGDHCLDVSEVIKVLKVPKGKQLTVWMSTKWKKL